MGNDVGFYVCACFIEVSVPMHATYHYALTSHGVIPDLDTPACAHVAIFELAFHPLL